MPDRSLVIVSGDGRERMRAALRAANLPADDIGGQVACFELAEPDRILGWGALEVFGHDALLRSILVAERSRGRGAGADLVDRLGEIARANGVTRLWLLTETAEPFFRARGFEKVERVAAPDAIRQTSEFRSVCPASAACMMLALS